MWDELLLLDELLMGEELALWGEVGRLALRQVLRLEHLGGTQGGGLPDEGVAGVSYAQGNRLSDGSIATKLSY